MKIAIIDDLEQETLTLSSYVTKYCQEHSIQIEIDQFLSVDALPSDFYSNTDYDLIFLDIYMNRDNGLEVARELRKNGFNNLIVFCTVSAEHAISGYSVQAFDYLLKPFNYTRFQETMNRCVKEISYDNHYITVKESRTYVKIRLEDIIFTDYHNHYIQIHTTRRLVKSYMSFSEFSQLLLGHPQFLNCYRNCIVNMDYIAHLKGYELVLKNGDIIPVTRNKKTEIRQKYANYEFYRLKKGE